MSDTKPRVQVSRSPSCPLCSLKGMSGFNEDVFYRTVDDDALSQRIRNHFVNAVTNREVEKHRRHLYIKTIVDKSSMPTKQVVEGNVRAISKEMSSLEKRGLVSSSAYITLNNRLREWTELRAKMDGSLVDKHQHELSPDFSAFLAGVMKRVTKDES